MKKIHLTIHLFPREIDDYEFTINQLKFSSQFISNLKIDANIILNLNDKIINWNKSKLPKEYFIERFKFINKKLDWVNNLEEEIVFKQEYHGKLEKVLYNTTLKGYNAFWWQDVDLIIDDLFLYGVEYALNEINESKFIISPQCFKFWDNSWDVISFSPNSSINVDKFDSFSIKQYHYNRNEISLTKNLQTKFAGGWGTIISNDLIKEVPFPSNAKGYGREDTLTAIWAMKKNYPQFILNNVIFQENRKYLSNSLYNNFIHYNLDYMKSINEKSLNSFYNLIDLVQNSKI